MSKVVAITGASAGVGRAAAIEFARHGCDVALIARNRERLDEAAAELRALGVRAIPIVADVADFAALEAAAAQAEHELGPIDVWVNNAMATIFAPVDRITPEEFRRATEVTYLGQVHGTMIALSRMRPRNRGTIVNIGSALAYRAIPLQSAYCGAKYAVRGFTDSLRSELLHDRVNIHLTMVHLPAVNTPQFDWALNKMRHRAQPVPPIFQPEVPARAIVFAALPSPSRSLGGHADGEDDPGQSHCPRTAGPHAGEDGLFRPTGRRGKARGRTCQFVPHRAGGLWRAWQVRCEGTGVELGVLCQPAPCRVARRPGGVGRNRGGSADERPAFFPTWQSLSQPASGQGG